MANSLQLDTSPISPELQMLRNNKQDGYNYRYRRQADWLENYTLYRDKVIYNRLLQRQSVNVPMMKTALRTLLKDVDDLPVVEFENLDNDKEAEVFKNEYWKITGDENHNKFDIQDIVDKRQVFLFGRSFDQWQIIDGEIVMTVQDPQDILVSRYMNPVDIHSSRYLIHQHIFMPLSIIEENPDYDKDEIARLKEWYATQYGLVKIANNQQSLVEKNKKLSEMGLQDVESPVLGETYVELALHFVFRKEEGDDEEQIYLYVEAENMAILMKKKLEDIIDPNRYCQDHFWRNHYPYNTWTDDIERQDFWSDGTADIIRTPNKVLNTWFSQMVENRTLRSFGMNFYNSSLEGFTPQSYDPKPFGWYGIPVPPNGSLADVYQKVDIPDLSESINEMQFVIDMVEKASGATSTQQGVQNQKQITLGEVQLALTEAKERIKGMSKFYTQVWKERGLMFIKLIEAGQDRLNEVKIYKKGNNTSDIYSRSINPKDWMTKSGYRCKVWSQEERSKLTTDQLEKLNAVKANMPDNPVVDDIYKRKLLEFSEFPPEKINDAMDYEDKKHQAMQSMMAQGQQAMMPGQTQPGLQQPQQQLGQLPVATQPTQGGVINGLTR